MNEIFKVNNWEEIQYVHKSKCYVCGNRTVNNSNDLLRINWKNEQIFNEIIQLNSKLSDNQHLISLNIGVRHVKESILNTKYLSSDFYECTAMFVGLICISSNSLYLTVSLISSIYSLNSVWANLKSQLKRDHIKYIIQLYSYVSLLRKEDSFL